MTLAADRKRLLVLLVLALDACLLCAAFGYSRYVDWPSFGGEARVRAILPEPYPVGDAHHYTYRNFMDTWELYRFETSIEAIAYLVEQLNLGPPNTVYEFPMIVSRPPPYWWHPEDLAQAEIYGSSQRAPDGRRYELLYSAQAGTAYLLRFDG